MTLIDSSIASQFDRLPPHSAEAEMCVLASMMLDKELIGQVVQLIRGEDFFQADHQIIFDVLLKMYEQNRPIDAILLREELGKRQLLEEVGGNAYLGTILNTVPSAAHGLHYAGVVRDFHFYTLNRAELTHAICHLLGRSLVAPRKAAA